jgi:hypothetical protein
MATSRLAQLISQDPQAAAELNALRKSDKRAAIDSQKVRSSLFYWSKFRLAGVVATGVLTFPTGKVAAFSYAINGAAASAGLPFNATEVETNLETAGATLPGETVQVVGIGIQLSPDTDGEVIRRLGANTAVRMVRGGGQPVRLGPLVSIPGGGGLHGSAPSRVVEPPQNAASTDRGAVSNGYPSALNYRSLPEPMLWTPQGSADGVLQVEIDVTRATAITLPATRAATSGIAAYNPPVTGDPGTYLEGWVFLYTESQRARSANQ